MYYNDELNRHKKSDTAKWVITFILIILLIAGLAGSWVYILKDRDQQEPPAIEEETANSAVGRVSLYAVRASSTEITVTATIYPAEAEDKTVDWTIDWQTPDEGFAVDKTVTDYVTVTPTAEGALTAVVKCLQPFEGYIDITVTTRDGQFTDTVTVVYEGKPGSFNIASSELSESGGYYNLKSGKFHYFDLTLDNEWGQVGDKFYDFDVSVKGFGTFIVQDKYKETYNSEFVWTGEERTINAGEWLDSFLSVNITEDNRLEVRTLKTVQNFGSERVIMGGGREVTNAYRSGGENVYFEITVSAPEGVSKTIKVKIVSSVTSVSIDKPSIVF